MGKIPQHFIDGLMARVDIVEVIGQRVPLKKAGREFKACCPFHDEKTPSFHVVPHKQFYHCFGCGAHGTALGFLMDYEQLSFVEAVEDLAGQLGMDVPREQGRRAPSQPEFDLYGLMDQASDFFQRELRDAPVAIDYLKRRGLSGKIAKRFAVGFAPKGWDGLLRHFDHIDNQHLETAGLIIEREESGGHYDRFRNRVMFPIRDPRGRTIAFGGRVIEDENPKYLNSPETPVFQKGRELYGLYEARQARFDLSTVLMVEGYMDVVALHEAGIGNVVATLGTACTRDHLVKLFRISQEVVFCFDGDNAGRKAAWRALETCLPEVRDGRTLSFLFLPDGHDPDSLVKEEGREAFERRVHQATPLSEFLINHLSADIDMSHLDGRARFAEAAKPLIQRVPNGIYRDMLIDSVARAASVSARTLTQHIPQQAASPSSARRPTPPKPEAPGKLSGYRKWVHAAIERIVHFPQIAARLEWPSKLEDLPIPGIPLLIEVLEELQESDIHNSAMLVERWRDRESKHYEYLMRIASKRSELEATEETGIEIAETFDRLVQTYEAEIRRDELQQLLYTGSITSEQNQELTQLNRFLARA
ncbi:MAG: DNA primase [Pseudomonadota bacterium]